MSDVVPFMATSKNPRKYPIRDSLCSPTELSQDSLRNRQRHAVFVVDQDHSIRQSLSALFMSRNLGCVTFESAAEYLQYPKPNLPSCLVLGVPLPDINGAALAGQITGDPHPPIIIIAAYCDIRSCVRAIKAGAVDYLIKPLAYQTVLKAVGAALKRDSRERLRRAELANLKTRYASLTPREREVLELVVGGLLNKQAAHKLGISEVTLQIHRGKVMRKMDAYSLADLVRMAIALEIPLTRVLSRTGEAGAARELKMQQNYEPPANFTLASVISGQSADGPSTCQETPSLSEGNGRIARTSQVDDSALYADRSGVSSIAGSEFGEDVFDSTFDGILGD